MKVIVGNILPKIPVLGIGVSSKVVGLLLVISINEIGIRECTFE